MKKEQRLISLRFSLIAISAVILIAIVTTLTVYSAGIQARADILSAKEQIQTQAQATGMSLKANMEVAMDASRTLAGVLSDQPAAFNPLSRYLVSEMLKKTLLNNPTFSVVS